MKKIITTLLLIVGVCVFAKAEKVKNSLMTSGTVVWAGLDYSMVRVVGDSPTFEYNLNNSKLLSSGIAEDKTNIVLMPNSKSYAALPSLFMQWNSLFLDEEINLVGVELKKRVCVDFYGVMERNKEVTSAQLASVPSPKSGVPEIHINKDDIASEVRSYKMDNTNGLGLVFIVDELVNVHHEPIASIAIQKATSSGKFNSACSIYIVFFDIASREIISAKREVHDMKVAGSLRNFWFGPIKDTVSNLDQYN